jgi:hypothetical protein
MCKSSLSRLSLRQHCHQTLVIHQPEGWFCLNLKVDCAYKATNL